MALRRFHFLNPMIHSQTHTLKGWPGHRLVKIGLATRPNIAKWQFQNSFLFLLGVWVKLVSDQGGSWMFMALPQIHLQQGCKCCAAVWGVEIWATKGQMISMESCWWSFHVHLCRPLFEDNLETTDWIVVHGAWVPNPPNADGCMPVAFWGLGFGNVKALLHKPRHQHLLVGDPLNLVG